MKINKTLFTHRKKRYHKHLKKCPNIEEVGLVNWAELKWSWSLFLLLVTGFNCSLFAYGQTGAGKSYSMVGYGNNK